LARGRGEHLRSAPGLAGLVHFRSKETPVFAGLDGIEDPFPAIFGPGPVTNGWKQTLVAFHSGKGRQPGCPSMQRDDPPFASIFRSATGDTVEDDLCSVRRPARRSVNPEVP